MKAMGMLPYGRSMPKEGYKRLSGLDEAVLENIDACKQLSAITHICFRYTREESWDFAEKVVQ